MKLFFTLLFCLITLTMAAQSQFENGFREGYKEGYCYKEFGCLAPIAPLAPIPALDEDMNSYKDGYKRGFKQGLEDKQKKASNSETNKPIDLTPHYVYTPNSSSLPEAFKREFRKYTRLDPSTQQWESWKEHACTIEFNRKDFKIYDSSSSTVLFSGRYKSITTDKANDGSTCIIILAEDTKGTMQGLQLFTNTGDVRYIEAANHLVIQYSMSP